MENRWNDAETKGMSDLELIAYASRLMGQEEDLVIVGGGNSSVKILEPDPITKRNTQVVYVKASGSDMKSMTPAGFAPVQRYRILPVINISKLTDVQMMDYGRLALQDPKARDPSVEYLLHVVLNQRFILHSHADALNALTAQAPEIDVNAILQGVFGPNVLSLPYIMPGFPLAKAVALAVNKEARNKKNHGIDHIVLNKHGLFTFGPTAKAAYDKHIEMVSLAEERIKSSLNGRKVFTAAYAHNLGAEASIELAARLPLFGKAISAATNIRGLLGTNPRFIVRLDNNPEVLEFSNSVEAMGLAPKALATPDHVIRTKGVALYVTPEQAATRQGLESAIDGLRQEYFAYFNRHNREGLRMLDPNPRVILVPEVGAFYVGRTAKDVADVGQIWQHTIRTIKAASAVGRFDSITEEERHQFEYWELEQRKLGTEKPLPLAGKVALITGAYGAIGSAVARRLSKEGAAVVLVDKNPDLGSLVAEINKYGSATGELTDVTNEESVARAFNCAALSYGGIDIVVQSVGILGSVSPVEKLDVSGLRAHFELNAIASAVVIKYASQMMIQQGTGGHIVGISTKNVHSPGEEFTAYSASKAAGHQVHLVSALELAKHGIRVNQVSPGDLPETSLWSPEVREMRAAKHNVEPARLADYYRDRSLLKVRIMPDDVASMVFAAEVYMPKTTGAVLRVDGGQKELVGR